MAVSGQFEYKSAKTLMSGYKSIVLYYFLLVGILIMLLFLAIVCICSRRSRHVHGNAIEEAHVLLPEIELVPLCASSQSEIEEITCVICISDIECGEEFVRLPCLHSYHTQCIDQWMQISPMCPLCNKTYNIKRSPLENGGV